MEKLYIPDAIKAVRKNLDEVEANGSVMFDTDSDNDNMDSIIRKTLPEAINAVLSGCPVALLEGLEVDLTPDDCELEDVEVSDAVVNITLPVPLQRLVAIKAVDSDFVVSEVIAESSSEGRKQLDKYIRGRYDNPRIVAASGKPEVLRYYSLADSSYDGFDYEDWKDEMSEIEMPVERLCYLPFYSEGADCPAYFTDTTPAGASGFLIPSALKENIINRLTAMTLAVFSEQDKAKYFADAAAV